MFLQDNQKPWQDMTNRRVDHFNGWWIVKQAGGGLCSCSVRQGVLRGQTIGLVLVGTIENDGCTEAARFADQVMRTLTLSIGTGR